MEYRRKLWKQVQPETQEAAVEIVLQKIQEVSHLQVQKTKVAKLKK